MSSKDYRNNSVSNVAGNELDDRGLISDRTMEFSLCNHGSTFRNHTGSYSGVPSAEMKVTGA
jgi:hypothetical protein